MFPDLSRGDVLLATLDAGLELVGQFHFVLQIILKPRLEFFNLLAREPTNSRFDFLHRAHAANLTQSDSLCQGVLRKDVLTTPVKHIEMNSMDPFRFGNLPRKLLITLADLLRETDHCFPRREHFRAEFKGQSSCHMTIKRDFKPRFDGTEIESIADVAIVNTVAQEDVQELPGTSPMLSASRKPSLNLLGCLFECVFKVAPLPNLKAVDVNTP